MSPFADVPQRALRVAEVGDPDRDPLDDTLLITDRHSVADAELVLDEHEEASEVVLDDLLGAEAERSADECTPDGEGSDVDTKDGEHPQRADGPHEARGRCSPPPSRVCSLAARAPQALPS